MFRIGLGFDVHAFAEGRELYLGGVAIPFTKGLAGHSDADVVLHAVMDAMLGALALGDIGRHFPDTDPAWRGARSTDLARRVWAMVAQSGYRLGNLDVVVLAEAPRIQPYSGQMRTVMAELFGAEERQISVKATTLEGLGFVGRREGIAAQAVVLLEQAPGQSR
ncbi:MAG: 2-C-methyl-D-erythritol 2,4-cyclodiphosphate synthase [Alicyclobacillus sp.]|nr:2-C-methyl-D-erythritol 2,4-cyclodiphosphate synthase [Alicyclobacillus sp.]